ncbi:MAG: hypothetical protein AAF383_19280 [Cyanobacteria bacterium P01_A01_bin.83]
MQYFFYSLFSLSLLSISGVAFAQDNNSPQPSANQYPAEFVQSYNQECIQTSMEEGLAAAEAETLCDCTINEFEQQYDLAEFQELTAASSTDPEAETALVEVGQFCFEQILYEQ